MEDKELFSRLKSAGGQVNPPESLEPSAVEDSLKGVRRKRTAAKTTVLCAAVLALVVAAAVYAGIPNDAGSLLKPAQPPVLAAKEQKNSYDTIYSIVYSAKADGGQGNVTSDAQNNVASGEAAEDALAKDIYGNAGQKNPNFSDTNTQVENVQEADIVKTDGSYIYAVNERMLFIEKAQDGVIKKQASVLLEKSGKENGKEFDIKPIELYVSGDRLTVICVKTKMNETNDDYLRDDMLVCGGYSRPSDTQAQVYDISDRAAPKLLNTLTVSGSYVSSRMVENMLYLVSDYNVVQTEVDRSKPETFVPTLAVGEQVKTVDSNDISIAKNADAQYTTIAAVDTENPTGFKSSKSVMGGGTTLYSTQENMYLAVNQYDQKTNKSSLQLLKYSLNGGVITLAEEAEVKGFLVNQFAMDEYDGYFRVVTTVSNMKEEFKDGVASAELLGETQHLYVFDGRLKQVGFLENNAKDEHLKSVRFDGIYAYFVTFRQTDPLFAVNLQNPQKPKIVSELKIPGFSQYLHPLSENSLLGFGMDADDDGVTTALKLSMFDTSDKLNVKEKFTLSFSDQTSSSSALYNHKALMIDPINKLIGMTVVEYRDNYSSANEYYYVFSYDEKEGFTQKAKILTDGSSAEFGDNVRGVTIGGYFYLCDAPAFTAYRLSDFSKVEN